MKKNICILAALLVACQAASLSIQRQPRHRQFNKYFLYTRNNPRVPEEIVLVNTTATDHVFLQNRTTTIIIHGHEGNAFNSLNPTVKDEILANEDVNVIVVDWSVYAGQSYTNAVGAVPDVGVGVAELIEYLVENEVAILAATHIVGFNLGAHVAGSAGRSLTSTSKVARITGLDPSKRQWLDSPWRLNRFDADYVEVIHTDGDSHGNGIGIPIGDVDFFANGGSNQPGCLFHSCSHERAWLFFAASMIRNHLIGNECSSKLQVSLNNCRGQILAMGNNQMDKFGSGIFRVNTRRTYPF